MKNTIFIAMLGLITVLSGCETVKGLGRDVQNLGHAIHTGDAHAPVAQTAPVATSTPAAYQQTDDRDMMIRR